MIDFAALVLGPAMAVFGQPVTVTPTASQPDAPSYQGRGVYASKPVQIPLGEGGYLSTVQPTLSIRLADFAVPPMQDDLVSTSQGSFLIADVIPDGQGGADCPLRSLSAPTQTTVEDGA